ncbi:unnamed protein product [Diamesa serratosioi]
MSDADVAEPKKGRGRPAGGAATDKKRKQEPVEKSEAPAAKKGRGRPKGSLKKTTAPKKADPKSKHPRKSKKKVASSDEEDSQEESQDSSA